MKLILEKIQGMKDLSLPSDKKIIYNCELCCDQGGYSKLGEDGIEYYSPCDCFKNNKTQRILTASQITFEFRKSTFGSWNPAWSPDIVRNAHKCSLSYIGSFDDIKSSRQNSIALLGKSGSGKTHLLSAISNVLLDRGITILYFPFVEGFNEIKDNFDLLESRINKMQKVEVLFIDDLFKGRKEPTQFQIEQMFAVINYRYLNNLPIMVSSERYITELLNIDEALGSRIYEMSKDFTVEMKGERLNYRMREAYPREGE
jgi:DNA replication protein DnaC